MEIFETDINGDGVDDLVAYEVLDDGGLVVAADVDGDGQFDLVAYDQDGDGVPDEIWADADFADTVPAEQAPEPAGIADYDAAYSSPNPAMDAAFLSDMAAMQHETNMTVINNI